MRYPVGVRFTWPEAIEAANESARMTGMRYAVEKLGPDLWEFTPVKAPLNHDPTRV